MSCRSPLKDATKHTSELTRPLAPAAEAGRPQLKPKRIRFVVDVSASMYRNQGDGRLTRSLEAGELSQLDSRRKMAVLTRAAFGLRAQSS